MEIQRFQKRLIELVAELASKKDISKREIEIRIERASGVHPQFFYNINSSRDVSIRYKSLEQIAAGMERVPLAFYTKEGNLEDLGIKGILKKGLPPNYVGKVFKKHRERLGLEPRKVAARSYLPLAVYTAYEDGTKMPTTRAIESISRVLEIVPLYLPNVRAKPKTVTEETPITIPDIDRIFEPAITGMERYSSRALAPNVASRIIEYTARIAKLAKGLRTKL